MRSILKAVFFNENCMPQRYIYVIILTYTISSYVAYIIICHTRYDERLYVPVHAEVRGADAGI